MKRRFALIGHPVAHSISPFIHHRLFELSKSPAEYTLLDIYPSELPIYLPGIKKLDGYNVTIPYKEKIVPFLNELCEKASLYGCVNTVSNTERTSFGYNTDAYGFLQALTLKNVSLGGNVTILGCGGAARVFCFEAALAGCKVTLAVRPQSLSKAVKLKEDVEKVTEQKVFVTTFSNIPSDVDLLINATPVGMHPNIQEKPISDAQLKNCKAVFDAVYNPVETALIKAARCNGSQVASGLPMLVYQAVQAHKIWTGAAFKEDDIWQLLDGAKEVLMKFDDDYERLEKSVF